ncbi:unnamed protein product, partial [Microthlaspi erraticum]
MSVASSSSVLQLRNNHQLLPVRSLKNSPAVASQLAVYGRRRAFNARCSVKKPAAPESPFMGTRLRRSGSETLQFWRSDGPGRSPKLKTVVRSSFSAVPEKPLGLYDPSFDKDSCGVGFVAELSGEASRKT